MLSSLVNVTLYINFFYLYNDARINESLCAHISITLRTELEHRDVALVFQVQEFMQNNVAYLQSIHVVFANSSIRLGL